MGRLSAPNSWATGMEKPEHMPRVKPMIIKYSGYAAETPAKASSPRYFDTMCPSVMTQSCCSSCPISTGKKNRSIRRTGLPVVMSMII